MAKNEDFAPEPDAAPEHVTPEGTAADTDTTAEWADKYAPGTELFVAAFEADDFDYSYADEYTDVPEYGDGTVVAVRRCLKKPPPGWIRKNAHLSDMERTFKLLEMHAAPEALEILDYLKQEPWDDFLECWGRDGGLLAGKSNRSARRFANTKGRSGATS